MNLSTSADFTLLRNCTIIEIMKLQNDKAMQTSEVQESIVAEFSELFNSLKNGNVTDILNKINFGKSTEFSNFINYFFRTSPSDISKYYLDLAQTLLTPERFEKIKPELEKYYEPEIEQTEQLESTYLTDDIQSDLEKLHQLLKHTNSKTITTSQFRSFAAQFRDLTLSLGISKFQQYFEENGQTIENMQISYDSEQYDKTVYKTVFTLLDSESPEKSLTITEPASYNSTYYQNLCCAYLEAHKYSSTSDELLNAEIMEKEFNKFSGYYENLKSMSTCKISLSPNGKVFSSAETSFEADKNKTFEQSDTLDPLFINDTHDEFEEK